MARLALRRGTLHLDRAVYQLYLAPLTGIVLVRDGRDLLLMPVRLAGAGGYLLKVRNAAGDRVVDAADFFRSQGIDDAVSIDFNVSWDEARGALVGAGVWAGAPAAVETKYAISE
jgi:hypothetical protein